MTSTAYDTQGSLLERGPEALRAAAVAASRQLPAAGALVADEPRGLTEAVDALAGPGARALTVAVSGAATGTVTLVVVPAVADALQDGPLGAADLSAALITPVTDAVAELEAAFGSSLQVGLADVVEAGAIDFGPSAVAVPLLDGDVTVAVLVVALSSDADTAGPADQPGDDSAAFTPFVDDGATAHAQRSMDLLHDVEMAVTVELGRTRMAVSDLLSLAPGAVVELDRAAGSPVDVLVNGKLIARGEVVVIDEDFGIRISEIVGLQQSPA